MRNSIDYPGERAPRRPAVIAQAGYTGKNHFSVTYGDQKVTVRAEDGVALVVEGRNDKIAAVEDRAAIVNDAAGGRLVQAEDGAAKGRLAAAGFADQTERFALFDLK